MSSAAPKSSDWNILHSILSNTTTNTSAKTHCALCLVKFGQKNTKLFKTTSHYIGEALLKKLGATFVDGHKANEKRLSATNWCLCQSRLKAVTNCEVTRLQPFEDALLSLWNCLHPSTGQLTLDGLNNVWQQVEVFYGLATIFYRLILQYVPSSADPGCKFDVEKATNLMLCLRASLMNASYDKTSWSMYVRMGKSDFNNIDQQFFTSGFQGLILLQYFQLEFGKLSFAISLENKSLAYPWTRVSPGERFAISLEEDSDHVRLINKAYYPRYGKEQMGRLLADRQNEDLLQPMVVVNAELLYVIRESGFSLLPFGCKYDKDKKTFTSSDYDVEGSIFLHTSGEHEHIVFEGAVKRRDENFLFYALIDGNIEVAWRVEQQGTDENGKRAALLKPYQFVPSAAIETLILYYQLIMSMVVKDVTLTFHDFSRR